MLQKRMRLKERIKIRQRFNEAMKKLESAIAVSYWAHKNNLVNSKPIANYSTSNASVPFKGPITNNSNIQGRNNVPFSRGLSYPNNNKINAGRKAVSLCFDHQFVNNTVNRKKGRPPSFTGDKRRTERNQFCGKSKSVVPFSRKGSMAVNKGVNRGKVTRPFSSSNQLKTTVVAKRSFNARKPSNRSVTKNISNMKNSRPTRGISRSDRKVKNQTGKIKERTEKLNITGKSVEVKFFNMAAPGEGLPNQLSQKLHENSPGEEGTAVDLNGVLYLEPHGELTVDNKSYGIEIRNENMSIIYDREPEDGKKGTKPGVKRLKDKAPSKNVRSKNVKLLRCHARKPIKKKAIHKKISKKSDSRRKSLKVKGNRHSKDKTRKKAGLKRKKKSGEKMKKSSRKLKGANKVVRKKLKEKSKRKPIKKSNKPVKKGSKGKRKISAKEAERRALEATGIISVSMVKKEVPEIEQFEEIPEGMLMLLKEEEEKKKENEAVNETEGEEVVVKKKRIVKSKSAATKKVKSRVKSKLKVKSAEHKKGKRAKQEGFNESIEELRTLLPHSRKFSMLAGDNF